MAKDDEFKEMEEILDRHRRGLGPPIETGGVVMPVSLELRAETRLDQLITDRGATYATLAALVQRGLSQSDAMELMRTAMHNCMVDSDAGMIDRWEAVARALREGRTFEELFPPALYKPEPGGAAN